MNELQFADRPIVLDETADEVDGTPRGPRRHRLRDLVQRTRARADDVGMATAEYAIGMVTATGLAGVLLGVVKGDVVKGLLTGIIRRALSV